MNHIYTTSDIAEFLGTTTQNVRTYIIKDYLKAIKDENEYKITHNDYISFREKYYDNGSRHHSRGSKPKLTKEYITLLSFVMSDLQNNDVSYKDFKKSYTNKKEIIPHIEQFIIYKRDEAIKFDNFKKGYRYKRLAEKYGLCIESIQKIVNN